MTKYKIEGMTCGGCVGSVTRAMQAALPGIKFEVLLEGGQIVIDGAHDAKLVEQTVEDAGFDFGGVAS